MGPLPVRPAAGRTLYGVNGIEISRVRFGDPLARTLIVAALADLAQRYGGDGDSTPITEADFDPPGGCFLVAQVAGEPVGCGGWRTLAADVDAAEIKRMYTVPKWRGKGVASALLDALEESARSGGKKRMVLETGDRQPEAVGLYYRAGYERIENFGHYKEHPACLSFGRPL
jgi:GNAT superfamily N-acetyltransferase